MSGVVLNISNIRESKILTRQEGEAYLKTLERGSALYREVHFILFQCLQGIYTCRDIKISTFAAGQGLLGGGFFDAIMKAVADQKQTDAKEAAYQVWETIFEKAPARTQEENAKTLADFQTRLSQVNSSQKQAFEDFLEEVETDFENASQTKDPVRMKKKFDDLVGYAREENQKYKELYNALKKEIVSHLTPTYVNTFNNIIHGNVSNEGSGILNFGQVTIKGGVGTGQTAAQKRISSREPKDKT